VSVRRNTYYNDRTVLLLGAIFENGNLSAKINANVDRYHEILMASQRELTGTFSASDMNLILTIVKPTWSKADRATAIVADFSRYSAIALDSACKSNPALHEQVAEIKNKLNSLSVAQTLCLVEAVESANKANRENE